MHISFRSGHSHSQKPSQAVSSNVAGVDVPVPKSSHRIRDFFSFGRPSSQKPLRASPSIANGVPPPSRPVAPPAIHHASPSPTADPDPGKGRDLLVVPQPSSTTTSQLSLSSQGSIHSSQPPDGNSYQLHAGQNIRMTHESRNAYVGGSNNHVTYTNTLNASSNKFMAELLQETIQGAAFDSSARDPPPRCHPGTRLAVIAQCLEFIAKATDQKKMLWVVGQAGVGKSAIMQNVAESPLPSISQRASIFLFINGRNDGAKIIMTLVYQLATQSEPYRQFSEHEIARHPALLQSSMSVQFKKFIIEPFVHQHLLDPAGRVLIIIDGLDECDKSSTQRELLRLIADTCSVHPTLSIVWIIASRPEHHITSFFDQGHVQGVYEKEVIEVDSDEARSDVERFLRAEMTRIQKEFSLWPRSQWPSEQDLWKLASASGGLFVYAQTAVKYIGDPEFADPISQLNDVLAVIDAHPLPHIPREQHPMALLDALYARILSKVPERIMVNTRKVLLALVLDSGIHQASRKGGFLTLCNWLGMTCDEAYAAIRHLDSVLSAPKRDKAHWEKLRSFHKSFIDYLSDFSRSGFSSDIAHEAQQLEIQNTIRVLEQAPDGIDCSDMNDELFNSSGHSIGFLASVPGAGSYITLTWSSDEDNDWSDNRTRLEVYKWAFANVVEGMVAGHSLFINEFYIRTVISRLRRRLTGFFPYRDLVDVVFEESRRRAFIKSGILKSIPVKELDFGCMRWETKLRFRRPSGTTTNASNSWDSSCQHERVGDWGEGEDEDWTTSFSMHAGHHFCCQRLKQQLQNWKTRSPDHKVTVLFTSARISFLEFRFIDPDDGASEWTYWITFGIEEWERRKLGSTI